MPGNDFVSPYLLRPLRSYKEALRDRERLNHRAGAPGDTAREGSSDVAESKEAEIPTHANRKRRR